MTSETLRALSRTYAAGDVDRDTYRLKRRALLQKISSGEMSVERYQPPEPEAPTLFPYDEDDGDTTQEIILTTSLSPPAPAAANAAVIAAIVASVTVIALLAWVGFHWFTERGDGAAENVTSAAPPAMESNLIANFLDANSWSSPSIANLIDEWKALAPERQAALRGSSPMRRMNDAILEQISVESGLIELGDAEEALDAQDELLELAERLGLRDDRLTRARARWTTIRESKLGVERDPVINTDTSVISEPALPIAVAQTDPLPMTDSEMAVRLAPPAELAGVAAANENVKPSATATVEATVPPRTQTAPAASPTVTAQGASARSNCKADLANSRRPYCIDVLASGAKGPVLVVIPAGTFEMGGERSNEQPRHNVAIDDALAFGLFEVSSAEYAQFCSATGKPCPAQPWADSALPVVNVSWEMAREYTAWLSGITGVTYRLPNEAEWEYAARAGSKTDYPFGNELLPTHARYSFKNAEDRPVAANDRSVNRNAFRLFHMIGNVREWVVDSWSDSYNSAPNDGTAVDSAASARRVARGGSYADHADALRSAARVALAANVGDIYTGFRVVRLINN